MRLDPFTILVTGGTGFFGRSLVNRLVAEGFSVRILSRSGNNSGHPNISMCHGDMTSLKDLRTALQGCRVIFHCAAEKNNDEKMTAVNVTGTKLLFELARDGRIQYFCHLSSVGVIGRTSLSLVDESATCNPTNHYEATKLAAEKIVAEGLDEGRVVILRPTNIFDAETLRPMLQKSFRSLLRVFLQGNENAHFVYAEDVVASAIYWMQAPSAKPVDTFIVSSDEELGNTHREIQELVASRSQVAPRAFGISAPPFVAYCARLLRTGNANRGDVIYSSRKLHRAGFNYPFGLYAGLNNAMNALRDSRIAHLTRE
jgi:nucleoside-diphosphate-sugar epimerase